MSQINFCSQCGAPLTDVSANFCGKCGYKFVRAEDDGRKDLSPTEKSHTQEETNTTGLVKNIYYTKYAQKIGIYGAITTSLSATLLFALILINLSSGWHHFSTDHIFFIAIAPFSFIVYSNLKKFTKAQTSNECACIIRRLTTLALCIIIIGLISSVGSIVGYLVSIVSRFIAHLAYIGLCCIILINIKNIKKYSHNDNFNKYVNLIYIFLLITIGFLLAMTTLSFMAHHSLIYYTLYSICQLSVITIVCIASLFTIFKLGRNAPEVTPEQLAEIKARL